MRKGAPFIAFHSPLRGCCQYPNTRGRSLRHVRLPLLRVTDFRIRIAAGLVAFVLPFAGIIHRHWSYQVRLFLSLPLESSIFAQSASEWTSPSLSWAPLLEIHFGTYRCSMLLFSHFAWVIQLSLFISTLWVFDAVLALGESFLLYRCDAGLVFFGTD